MLKGHMRMGANDLVWVEAWLACRDDHNLWRVEEEFMNNHK